MDSKLFPEGIERCSLGKFLAWLGFIAIGLAWGGYRAAQSPTFWGDVAAAAWAAIGPSLADLVKSSPAIQAEAQQRAREGRMGDPHAGREK